MDDAVVTAANAVRNDRRDGFDCEMMGMKFRSSSRLSSMDALSFFKVLDAFCE